VEQDPANAVLGEPEHYFKLYQREELEQLALRCQPARPIGADDWMVPFASGVELDQLKYPVVLVQEFGLSVFRLAASVTLALENHPNCELLTRCRLAGADKTANGWRLSCLNANDEPKSLSVDFLVNASGYRSGSIDDMTAQPRERLVEFKSAYISKWQESGMQWPEVIFHGERGTPQGMAQLTPYADGYFQLHGMTEQITLFKDGLVASGDNSSQPFLPEGLEGKIRQGWQQELVNERTERAIAHVSRFIPAFASASTGGKPLYGAQQIPGRDPSLRAVDVSFTEKHYARIEIVKASSAYQAADKIARHLGLGSDKDKAASIESLHGAVTCLDAGRVEATAIELAIRRNYPPSLAKKTG
jgi:hypothetical protein